MCLSVVPIDKFFACTIGIIKQYYLKQSDFGASSISLLTQFRSINTVHASLFSSPCENTAYFSITPNSSGSIINSNQGLNNQTHKSIAMDCAPEEWQSQTLSPVQFIERSPDKALIEHKVSLELKSAYPVVRASTTKQLLQCLVSIKSQGQTEMDNRFIRYGNVDLICVIDVSGSMSGNKLELVKKSLTYVLSKLTPRDRLAIVKFATRAEVLCNLTSAAESAKLNDIINRLKTEDSTNIRAGLGLAYDIIKKNTESENLQCVLLLSDGMDMEGFTVAGVATQLEEHFGAKRPPFTTYSLGYGSDHDPKIMKAAAKAQGGKFRFVERDEDLDSIVAKLLGGLFSAIASKIIIKVRAVSEGALTGTRILKVFGSSVQVDINNEYTIPIVQYRAGSTNSYAIEVELPIGDSRLDKAAYDRPFSILEATAELVPLSAKLEPVRLGSKLEVSVLHPDSILKKGVPDQEVVEYHCRAAVVEIIKVCGKLMEQQRSTDAKAELQRAHEILNRAPATEKIRELREDVQRMVEKANQKDYRNAYRLCTDRQEFYGECEEQCWGESMMNRDIGIHRRNERRRG